MKSANGAFGSEFQVGGVVYFISSKTEQVIPALVAEKITRATLDCEIKVTYVLKLRQGSTFKEIEVDPIKTELFSDTEDVRKFMMKRTSEAIDLLIEAAVKVSRQLKPENAQPSIEPQDLSPPADLNNVTPDEPAEVVLPDGTVAKLRM